ncbi:dienelactone hydrolase family protein [Aequorivita sp. SDUM287046]|uniref:Dienelactone hydrolase family protein n=1 Tax=Aequorivita aurantiaca TaxID=3053356 RepID=A0ABT8DH90_9FLAO|nr:dienelactone hydrolase family protein [Aequorivita aurantiaca]MDN3724119.1 dienelactone hydrolase family protein [Aequorivita aurantiaca]
MHRKNIIRAGKSLQDAEKALIMVHGRGADPHDIIRVASHLNVSEYALLAPAATNNTWYPYSFMAPPAQNEPWLFSALDLLEEVVAEITEQGITPNSIFFMGFSQGACLTLEFVARHAQKYGGVAAFTGGMIGDTLSPENYSGDFEGTSIFISTGDPDPHVPLERVKESVALLQIMNASVHIEVYKGRPHTISQDEIDKANKMIFG